MSVLITGGSGFIGSHVVDYFLSKKIDLTCLVRKKSSLDFFNNKKVNFVFGDIRNYKSIKDNFKNIDFVIHIAGHSSDWGFYKDFYETNVEGTLNILKACRENSIFNAIITSSCSVYGEENSKYIKNEEFENNSHYKYFLDRIFPSRMNYYRDTKKTAKQEAVNFAMRNNINLTIIEPVWVYGEREFNTGFYEYLKTAKLLPFIQGYRKNKFHVIYAQDLAIAFYLAYKKKLKGINSFIIGNDRADFMDQIFTLFCKEAGFKKPNNLPKFIVYPIGFILELLYTILSIKKPPILTRARVNMFYDNIEYSIEKAKKILGFKQETSLEDGFKKTLSWYRKNKYI